MTRRLTVVGARGFIGTHVARRAAAAGWNVVACSHDEIPDEPLGTVAYCSGVASGAERRPAEAYRLHAQVPLFIVERRIWERVIFVSSTRVYGRAHSTSEEEPVPVRTDEIGDTYAASKLAGEAIVLSASPENRVVRCSNVYGPSLRSELFLSDVLRQAASTGRIAVRTAPSSSKDYVSVDDVAARVLDVASGSRHRIYNLAAGRNTTNEALLDAIARAIRVEVTIAPGSPSIVVPHIDVARVQAEFPFEPRDVLGDVPELVRAFQNAGG